MVLNNDTPVVTKEDAVTESLNFNVNLVLEPKIGT